MLFYMVPPWKGYSIWKIWVISAENSVFRCASICCFQVVSNWVIHTFSAFSLNSLSSLNSLNSFNSHNSRFYKFTSNTSASSDRLSSIFYVKQTSSILPLITLSEVISIGWLDGLAWLAGWLFSGLVSWLVLVESWDLLVGWILVILSLSPSLSPRLWLEPSFYLTDSSLTTAQSQCTMTQGGKLRK